MAEIVRQVYENGASAFSNAAHVFREVRQTNPGLTRREVTAQLRALPSYTRHRRVKRRFSTGKVMSGGYMETVQADLMDLSRYSRWNKGFKYVLVAIDVFSKMAFAQPLKRKNDSAKAFQTMLHDFPLRPLYLHVDRGTEFYNAEMRQILKKHLICMYSTNSVYKANVAERLIRTLRKRLARYFEHFGTWQWIDHLPKLLANYNNTTHSTIGMKPTSVGLHNQKELWKKLYKTQIRDSGEAKFALGDIVRISKSRSAFDKEAYDMFSEEVYVVTRVCPGPPIYYRIADLAGEEIGGRFYRSELTETVRPERFTIEKILRRNVLINGIPHHFVCWRGYPASFNSFVKAVDVINIR